MNILYFRTKRQVMDQTLAIAIETSGRMGSAALAAGENLLEEHRFSGPMKHSCELFPAIQGLLKRHELTPGRIEHIYISSGPGSFTGLRISVTAAKMISFACGAKIAAADTLDVIAANITASGPAEQDNAGECKKLAVVLDAKRGGFFTAVYERQDNVWEKTLNSCILTPEKLITEYSDKNTPLYICGEGLINHRMRFRSANTVIMKESLWMPSAASLCRIARQKALKAQFEDIHALKPLYLRTPDVNRAGTSFGRR